VHFREILSGYFLFPRFDWSIFVMQLVAKHMKEIIMNIFLAFFPKNSQILKNRANILYCMRGTPRHSSTPIRLNVEYRAPIALALAQPFKTDLPCKSRIISNNIPLPSRRAGDDCADMTCYNPGSPKLPEIHRYDCACTKFNPLTGRVIRKVPVPVCK
jgi:hypothetical protein